MEQHTSIVNNACKIKNGEGALHLVVTNKTLFGKVMPGIVWCRRTDLIKSYYKNFNELYLYCDYVATVGLMSVHASRTLKGQSIFGKRRKRHTNREKFVGFVPKIERF